VPISVPFFPPLLRSVLIICIEQIRILRVIVRNAFSVTVRLLTERRVIINTSIYIRSLSGMALRSSGLVNPYKVCGIHVGLKYTDLQGEESVKANQF
jgi:hypothetical protein